MTTLLVFVFLIGGSTESGASTATQRVDFLHTEQCESARKAVEGSGDMSNSKNLRGGIWQIRATCVRGVTK
jgi:hypothetical protein